MTSSTTSTGWTFPIRTAGSRTPTRPRCSAGPTRRTPPRASALDAFPAAPRSRSGSGSSTRSARSACRCSRPLKAGRAPLLLHAPRRQAEPAGPLRARRRGRRRPGAGRRQRRARRRHARARLVVPVGRRRAGRLRRVRRRQRGVDAARARRGDGRGRSPTRSRARAPARWRGCPTASGFYYTRYPAPGEVPAAEEKYHRAVFHHRLGDDPAQGPQAVRRRARHDRLAGRRPVARRPLAGDHGQPGLVEERGLLARRPRRRRARRRSSTGERRAVQRRRDAGRSPLPVHDQRRAARPAVRGRSGAARARALARGDARERDEVLQDVAVLSAAGLAAASLQDARAAAAPLRSTTARRAARSRCPGWAR